MWPLERGRLGHAPERVTASVTCKGEVEHVQNRSDVNFEKYPEGGTTSVSHKGDPTKSGYLTFDPGGIHTINCSSLDQDSESNNSPRCEPNKITESIL